MCAPSQLLPTQSLGAAGMRIYQTLVYDLPAGAPSFSGLTGLRAVLKLPMWVCLIMEERRMLFVWVHFP